MCLEKGSELRDQLIVSLYMYTIYLSICTQTAVPNFPHPFRGTHSTCTFISPTAMFSLEIDPDATPRPWTAFTLPFPIDLFPTPKVQEVQSSTPLQFGFPHTNKNLKGIAIFVKKMFRNHLKPYLASTQSIHPCWVSKILLSLFVSIPNNVSFQRLLLPVIS